MDRIQTPPANEWRDDLSRLAEPLRADANRAPLFERLLKQMPPYLRERVEGEVTTLRKAFADPGNPFTREQMNVILNQRVKAGYKEVATDLVLSHNGTIIQSYQCLRALVAYDLEREVLTADAPNVIDHTGTIFLDVDGMKTIVDCTNHNNGCRYLQRLADILVSPPADIADWCRQNGLSTEAYSVGGDEFLVLVKSERFLTEDLLKELESRLRTAIENDQALRTQFVDFNDPSFLLDYGFIGEERREKVLALDSDEERRTELNDIRAQLPQEFIPSVSMGTSKFSQAVEQAVEQATNQSEQDEEVQSFDAVAFNAFQVMVQLADDRTANGKRHKKQLMKEHDPKLYAFLMRNAEGRELLNELGAKDEVIKRLIFSIAKLKKEIEEMLREVSVMTDKDQIIAKQHITILQAQTNLELLSTVESVIKMAV